MADSVEVSGAGRIASQSMSRGEGGAITIDASTVAIFDRGQIAALAQDQGNGGSVTIDADSLSIGGQGQLFTVTTDRGRAGNVTVTTTGGVTIAGDNPVVPAGIFARSGFDLNTSATGQGGNVTVDVRSLEMTGNAVVSARTFGIGDAGNITILADQLVALRGDAIGRPEISAKGLSGDGGLIHIESGLVSIEAGAGISSSTFLEDGGAGDIEILADDLLVTGTDGSLNHSAILSEASSADSGAGDSGRIMIDLERGLVVSDGGQISVSSRGPGNSDLIDIRAAGRVEVRDGGEIASRARASGTADDIEISEASEVLVGDGGLITAESLASGDAGSVRIDEVEHVSVEAGGRVSATASGTGEAGDVSIVADEIEVTGGSITTDAMNGVAADPGGDIVLDGADGVTLQDDALVSARTFGSQDAGNIAISSQSFVELRDGATISGESLPSCSPCAPSEVGDAGSITVDAGKTFFAVDSRVATTAEAASGGDIAIDASKKIELVDSEVTTSVLGGVGEGGDIEMGLVNTPEVVVLNASSVIADADADDAGNIRIRTDAFIPSADSFLRAHSNLGVDGVIVVEAPEDQLKQNVAQLPATFLDATQLLKEHCAARAAGTSTFVVRGRDGMPESPDSPLPSRTPLPRFRGPAKTAIPEAARRLATLDCSGRAALAAGRVP